MTPESLRVGPHSLQVEEDTLVFRLHGLFSLADATTFYAVVERVHATHGHCFMLADVSGLGSIDMEARRYVAGRVHRQIDAVAVHGANAMIRTIAELLFSAIRLMRRRTTAAIVFVNDEAEARRWLAEQRTSPPAKL